MRRANAWDRMVEAIGESAAMEAARRVADPLLAAGESALGLGEATRRALFGEGGGDYRSLLLNYAEHLRKRMRAEREAGEGGDPARVGSVRGPGPGEILEGLRKRLGPPPKVFEGDRMSSRERIDRHVRFDGPDRVGWAPLMGFHTARAGGITVREFMTDGGLAGDAAQRAWDLYGGFDMIPFTFPMGYLFPFMPESHSRFCSEWTLPESDELPRMEEVRRISGWEAVEREGLGVTARTEGGRLLRELAEMLPQGAAFAAKMAVHFPWSERYSPYAMGVINHPADLLSMWMGFENFMMDCAMDPGKVREACERLGPGLVEMGVLPARALGARQVLYGGSRMSGSFVSRKMFDNIFAETFLSQVQQANRDGFLLTYHLDNDYTLFLDFFLQFPRHSGIMHLDQTDLVAAKKVLHGHLCLMGNLHPGLLAAGTPERVGAEAERLVREVGAGGGFILSSACEVPVDTPEANLRAARDAVEKYGWY